MGKLLFAIGGLIVGLLAGAAVVGPMVIGTAAGVGIATGLSAGVCSTVIAAQDEGLLDAAQVDQVLSRAVANMAGGAAPVETGELVGSAAQCDEVMRKLAEAAGS
ncbi:hypothetical protein [Mangrovicoccus ximenensis]|uniref:hypothetical protein n=1 Tax=Mangrovicoccus ximenensis TaxID=1911570 RepID=UPI000D33F6E7|nr:hypothetical protein [Mangrovicoccus ximenensis]